jgi:hypothetical protein
MEFDAIQELRTMEFEAIESGGSITRKADQHRAISRTHP